MQQPVTESRNAITEHRMRVAELARVRAAVMDRDGMGRACLGRPKWLVAGRKVDARTRGVHGSACRANEPYSRWSKLLAL
jgi:hypothetical protein